eukprot:CFRG6830T1
MFSLAADTVGGHTSKKTAHLTSFIDDHHWGAHKHNALYDLRSIRLLLQGLSVCIQSDTFRIVKRHNWLMCFY